MNRKNCKMLFAGILKTKLLRNTNLQKKYFSLNTSHILKNRYEGTHDNKCTGKKYRQQYDVIVIGGGHAGCEACSASARMGAKTLLVTHKKSSIGAMSCNPSFGGIGKGHLVREIDALDGLCGRLCDSTGISYKIINTKKGPAVWGYRAQIDREMYRQAMQEEIFNTKNLKVIEAGVEDLILESLNNTKTVSPGESNSSCIGVTLADGTEVFSDCVVLTTGTFLRGTINVGLEVTSAGRMGDEPAVGLAQTLEKLNFSLGRLKTGTPPRIDKTTIDFSVCNSQEPDNPPRPFSFLNDRVWIKPEDQLRCYLTHTNKEVEKFVLSTLHLNRHVQEEVVGPRYCPSLESKILRYPSRNHQIWLEPEGLESSVVYPQGLTCTMPVDDQQALIRVVSGLEKAVIVQPGYGVEYDYVNPQELSPSLETKKVPGLFFAGQINGTTGYEEAAAQGIIAGVNAAARSLKKPQLLIDRTEGYIGVLIDDLTTQGIFEPYRMFTSRSEFRFSLRPDNADLRLTHKGYEVGCVSEDRFHKSQDVKQKLQHWMETLNSDRRSINAWSKIFEKMNTQPSKCGRKTGIEILGIVNWNVGIEDFCRLDSHYESLSNEKQLWERLKFHAIYENAIKIETRHMQDVRRDQALVIPDHFDYTQPGLQLSIEIRDSLSRIRPPTIGAASMIPGVTPLAISQLFTSLLQVKKKKYYN